MFIFIFILFLSSNEVFNTANEHYKNQEFELALEDYLKLEKETKSLELYYNVANTYFRLNKLGLAKAYYLKVLKYDTNNKDAIHNLNVLNASLGISDGVNIIDKLKKYFSLNLLAIINLLLFISFLVLSFIIIKNFKNKKLSLSILFSLINIFILFVISIILTYLIYVSNNKRLAVVISSNSSIFSEPNVNSKELVKLNEGTKLEIESCNNNWCKIIYDKKIIAWISFNSLMEI